MQLLKALRLPILIGLLIILLRRMIQPQNQKAGQINRQIIAGSSYSNYADVILAQAKHESANFTSKVYRDNNNPFGMKTPSKRPFLGTQGSKASDGGYYARYLNDSEAFKDFLLWLSYNNIPNNFTTIEQYVSAIRSKGYFTDTLDNYINALKRWLK